MHSKEIYCNLLQSTPNGPSTLASASLVFKYFDIQFSCLLMFLIRWVEVILDLAVEYLLYETLGFASRFKLEFYLHDTNSFFLKLQNRAPVHMADIMVKVNANGKQRRKWHVCCAVLHYISYANPWSSLGLPSPLWIQKQSNYRHLHTMFTAACDPPEKLILSLVPCSNVQRMILNLTYNEYDELNSVQECAVGSSTANSIKTRLLCISECCNSEKQNTHICHRLRFAVTN